MKHRNHSAVPSSYSTFPCSSCHRIVRSGDRFCGFCHKPLQVQCSHCGRWTKANHVVCPDCGKGLHESGLTFEERTRLQTLQQQAQELQHDRMESQHHLDTLGRTRKWAMSRMLGVGLLTIVAIVVLIMLMSHLSLVWLVVILIMIVLCRRQIPGLVQAYARCYAFPWSQMQHEMDEARHVLTSLEAEAQQIEGAIAPLEARIVSMSWAQLKHLEEEEKEERQQEKQDQQ